MPTDTKDPFAQSPGASDPGWARRMVNPRYWTATDWITTAAPIVLEAAAASAPEVTLPLLGVMDTGKALSFLGSTRLGRTLLSTAIGATAGKLTGTGAVKGGVTAGIGNALGETGVGLLHGATKAVARGGRKMLLLQTSRDLADLVSEKLPLLSSALKSGSSKAANLAALFRRPTSAGRSFAEKTYGSELGKVEDDIESQMRAHAIWQAKQGKTASKLPALPGQVSSNPSIDMTQVLKAQQLFPVHVIDDQGNWVVQHMPFKDAVAVMRDKWPRGYRFTGTERDSIAANEWRHYRSLDSQAIGQKLRSVSPQLADAWQGARNKWELAHTFANIFSDPKSFDRITGEVNSEQVANHLYGATPAKLNEKAYLERIAGPEYANRVHGAVIHESAKPGEQLPLTSDVLGPGGHGRVGLSFSAFPPFVHPYVHEAGGAGLHVTGSNLPWVHPIPEAVLRAAGRHGTTQAVEDTTGEE